MKNAVQTIKKIVLFLFGVILIITGYKVNASNNEIKINDEKDKAPKESEQQPLSPINKEPEKELQITTEESTYKITPSEQISRKQEPISNTKTTPAKPTVSEGKTEKKAVEQPKIDEPKQTVIETATPEESSGTE